MSNLTKGAHHKPFFFRQEAPDSPKFAQRHEVRSVLMPRTFPHEGLTEGRTIHVEISSCERETLKKEGDATERYWEL